MVIRSSHIAAEQIVCSCVKVGEDEPADIGVFPVVRASTGAGDGHYCGYESGGGQGWPELFYKDGNGWPFFSNRE